MIGFSAQSTLRHRVPVELVTPPGATASREPVSSHAIPVPQSPPTPMTLRRLRFGLQVVGNALGGAVLLAALWLAPQLLARLLGIG